MPIQARNGTTVAQTVAERSELEEAGAGRLCLCAIDLLQAFFYVLLERFGHSLLFLFACLTNLCVCTAVYHVRTWLNLQQLRFNRFAARVQALLLSFLEQVLRSGACVH